MEGSEIRREKDLMSGDMLSIRVVIVGSGSSSSTPKLDCVVQGLPCAACIDAVRHGTASRNHRLNPSLLIQINIDGELSETKPTDAALTSPSRSRCHNVLIDCGKTFREAALKVLWPNHVQKLAAVLLTHHHCDAVMGLDDLREFSSPHAPVTVYGDATTLASVGGAFPYLMPPRNEETAAGPKRWVASIQWRELVNSGAVSEIPLCRRSGAEPQPDGGDRIATATAASLPFVAFPVPHGGDCISNAFVFPLSANGSRTLVYMSDVSVVDDTVLLRMQNAVKTLKCHFRASPVQEEEEEQQAAQAPPAIDVLVLDMLSTREYFAHLNVDQAIAAAREINASRTIFIGMGHGLEYHELSELVHRHGGSSEDDGWRLEVGYDGMIIADGHHPTTIA